MVPADDVSSVFTKSDSILWVFSSFVYMHQLIFKKDKNTENAFQNTCSSVWSIRTLVCLADLQHNRFQIKRNKIIVRIFSSRGAWSCNIYIGWTVLDLFSISEDCSKGTMISAQFISCGCNHIKAGSQHFYLMVRVSLLIKCVEIKNKTDVLIPTLLQKNPWSFIHGWTACCTNIESLWEMEMNIITQIMELGIRSISKTKSFYWSFSLVCAS